MRCIYNKCALNVQGFNWWKQGSVATHGAPAIISKRMGLVGLLKEKVQKFGSSISAIHRILHQDASCR